MFFATQRSRCNMTLDTIKALAPCPTPYRQGAVERWVYQALPPGGFLTAVLLNDLERAARHADQHNAAHLDEWAKYVNQYLPPQCHGSQEALDTWKGLLSHDWSYSVPHFQLALGKIPYKCWSPFPHGVGKKNQWLLSSCWLPCCWWWLCSHALHF